MVDRVGQASVQYHCFQCRTQSTCQRLMISSSSVYHKIYSNLGRLEAGQLQRALSVHTDAATHDLTQNRTSCSYCNNLHNVSALLSCGRRCLLRPVESRTSHAQVKQCVKIPLYAPNHLNKAANHRMTASTSTYSLSRSTTISGSPSKAQSESPRQVPRLCQNQDQLKATVRNKRVCRLPNKQFQTSPNKDEDKKAPFPFGGPSRRKKSNDVLSIQA